MPPKKNKNKNKDNPFYYFMLEKKTDVERKLRRKVSMAELPDIIYHEWQALSETAKTRFKDMCTNSNRSCEKYDSRGLPLSQLQREKDAEQTQEKEMIKSIKRTVSMLQAGKAIPNETFFVICITHYICKDNGTFLPAEIGMCQFSLAKGILSHYHKVLPVVIPLGYKYQAIQHSEKTHKLLLNQLATAGDFIRELEQFLTKDGDKVLNLYTQNDFMVPVDAMIKDFHLISTVNVYSLDCLFKHLYSASLMDIPESVATEMLTSCVFDYMPSLPCSWHQEVAPDAGIFCALSYSKRWIFNMCDSLRLEETFGIQPQKERHFPEDTLLSILCDNFESVTLKSPMGPSASGPTPTREQFSRPSFVFHEFQEQPKSLGCPSFESGSKARIVIKESKPGMAEGGEIKIGQLELIGIGRGRRNVEKCSSQMSKKSVL